MIAAKELKKWLAVIGDEEGVYISEDGLTLEVYEDPKVSDYYIEVGGKPEEAE